MDESSVQSLNLAHEQIQALNTELSMHDDAKAQVGALRRKIACTKDRARALVRMIDKRIAYLSDVWEKQLASRDENDNLEIAKGAVSEPVRIGLSKDGDESFFARVNVLKDKVAELVQLDELAADAHKKAAADNKTLNTAADMLKEVEDRQRAMLANNDRLYSEGKYPVLSLRRTIAAIDSRLQLDGVTNEERNDLEKLAKDLRVFLTRLPDHGSYSKTHHSPSGSPTELRVNFTHSSLSSTGISGSTVSTNETSSAYTTSPYQSDSVNQTGKQRASHTSSQSVGTATTSTLPI